MTAPSISVTDYHLAQQIADGVVLGRSFAFLPGDLLDRPALKWVKLLVPAASTRPRVVPLLAGPVELPGLTIRAPERPALSMTVVTSDKALYREGADVVNLLVCDPFGCDRELELAIAVSGQPFAKRPVKLSARGAGEVTLRDLPCGDYEIRASGAPASDPPCTFTVAEYRLSPLVAMLDQQRLEGERLALAVTLTTFGIPHSGPVDVELHDAGRRIERTQATAHDGKLAVTLALRGAGPHTVNFQLASDPGRTATIPIVGSRIAERTDTVFSTLGAEVVGSLLPGDDEAPEVRGIYLRRGGTSTSPVRLDRVDARRPKLTAMVDLDTLAIAIIDPTLARHPDAVDVATASHPAHDDDNYRHGEQLFLDGKFEAALETFVGARARIARPHPNYAYYIACCHARLGERAAGLRALRLAFREGWADLAHLRGDADLAALRAEPEFELLANGGVRIVETPLARGESVTLDVAAPLAYLALGAFVEGRPWEGHAAIVAPPAAELALAVPETVTPGSDVEIGVTTSAAATAVYVIVKDARLLSADTPKSRLGGQLKSHVDAMRSRALLATGPVTERLDLPPPAPPRPPPMYSPSLPYGGPPPMPGAMPAPSAPRGGAMMLGGMPTGVGAMPQSMPTMARAAMPQAPEGRDFGAGAMPDLSVSHSLGAARTMMSEVGGAAPTDEAPASEPGPSADEVPEVVYAGLAEVRGGSATLVVPIGELFADYVVEAFAIDGVEWTSATARFRAERAVFAAFDVPAFVHREDTALGRLVVGGRSAGVSVELTRDGTHIPFTADGEPVTPGAPIVHSRAEIAFVAQPGDYAVKVVDSATGELFEARARVDEPSRLRRLARAVQFLQPGERISRRDDPSILSLRALPGLDKPFALLCDATADYGHACCEQTAGKLLAACSMYMFAGDDAKRRRRAEDIVIAGVRRERSMFLPGRGFKMYPDSSNSPHEYYGTLTAKYLWNVELLRGAQTSRALVQAIDDGLEMARDATRAYRLPWPPTKPSEPVDAYAAIRFGQDARVKDKAVSLLRSWATEHATPKAHPRGAVGFRADAAYAAAGLFHAGGDGSFPGALALANRVIGDLGSEGRLYSTVDSVAAIALLTEIQRAGVIGRGARAIVDGRTVPIDGVDHDATEIAAADATVAVEVTRIVEEDWDRFTAGLDITVTMLAKGRPTARVLVGEPVDLEVRLGGGYQVGDLVWVALPDALSRVIGGGQVKRFSIDFAGRDHLTIPLAATAITVDRDGQEAPQHFAVCVRNMFEEERAGNPGPLDIAVVPPKGDGLLSRAASALRRLLS